MVINKLYINIAIRVLILTLTCLVFGYIFANFSDPVINLNFAFFIILQTFLLIRKLNITNNILSLFFNSIQYDDSALVLSNRNNWKSYQKLLDALDTLNDNISKLKIKSAGQEAYFENLVENVNIGLISIDSKKRILIFNPAARKLLNYTGKTPPLYFDKSFPELFRTIVDQKPHEQKLVKIISGSEVLHLAVRMNPVHIFDRKTQLISLQDIRSELDERELETWQKMIRVLTHEIMNSISPISSTISTINEFLTFDQDDKTKESRSITKETIKDIVQGLNIIEERSIGLVEFVDKFRSLTLLSRLQLKNIKVIDMFNDVELLLRTVLSEKQIKIIHSVEPENLVLNADPGLLQQMLINIINNSIEALATTSSPIINLRAYLQNENTIIEIVDNGQGIPADQIDDIFIPFFSTKEQGSGIGLSLSKQIMHLHNGDIIIESIPDKKTIVFLQF